MRYWVTFGEIKGRYNAAVRGDDGYLAERSFSTLPEATEWAKRTKQRLIQDAARGEAVHNAIRAKLGKRKKH